MYMMKYTQTYRVFTKEVNTFTKVYYGMTIIKYNIYL